MPSLMISNTRVFTEAGATVQAGMDILVEDGLIERIVPHGSFPAAERRCATIDGASFIAMPGLINAHTHSNESFELGRYDAMPLELWLLYKYPPGAVRPVDARVHYLRTMLLAIDNVRAGITTVQDDLINPAFEAHALDASAAAYRDIGLRATLTVSMGDRSLTSPLPWIDELMPPDQRAELATLIPPTAAAHLALFERHFDRWHESHQGRLRINAAPIGPQWCSDELLMRSAALAAERNIGVHMHTLESRLHAVTAQRLYGCTLIEHLDRIGMLSPRLTLNHAIWLTDDDIRRLADHGCSITHNPASNLKLGSGIARIPELLRAGVNIALGTDGTSTADRSDLFRSLGLAATLHRTGSFDPDEWPTATDAVRMATVGGALSAGCNSGRLAAGCNADIVLLSHRDFGFLDTDAFDARLAFAANAESIDTVIVGGDIVLRGRRLCHVDEAALRAEIAEVALRYLNEHVYPGESVARRFEPAMRAILARAAEEPLAVPDAAVRIRRPFSRGTRT